LFVATPLDSYTYKNSEKSREGFRPLRGYSL